MPSIAIEEPPRCPSPSRSCHAVHCRRGAVAPSLATTEPSAVSTSHPHSGRSHHQHPSLVTPLPGLASGWLSRCLSSRCHLPSAGASHYGIAFRASCPSGWLPRLLASHAATSYLLVPPPLIAPSPLVTPLSGLSSGWLRHRLSSRRRHQSAGSLKTVSGAV